MTKPLQLLQEYTTNKKEVLENENEVIFGEFSFPKDFLTDCEITQKSTAERQYYTIGCLLFFIQNMHLIHPEYCERAKASNIPAVRRPDRKNIINYLTGVTKTMESVSASQDKKNNGKKSRNKKQNKYTPY